MKTLITIIVSALSAQSLAFATPATEAYTFTTIDGPAADSGETTYAFGINSAGDIVGAVGIHGFLYSGGTFTPIDVPGAFSTAAEGINNNGQIVGSYRDSVGTHGFLYRDGSFTPIDVPGSGTVNGAATRANGINAAGEIVGDFDSSTGTHGYLYSGGVFTIIDFPDSYFTQAFGINARGQIVGSMAFPGVGGDSGFVYSRGIFTPLNDPASNSGGDLVTIALGINNAGQIVGLFTDGEYRGFVYDDGTFTTIDLPAGGDEFNPALGINEAGQIVGYFNSATGVHGYLATPMHRR